MPRIEYDRTPVGGVTTLISVGADGLPEPMSTPMVVGLSALAGVVLGMAAKPKSRNLARIGGFLGALFLLRRP